MNKKVFALVMVITFVAAIPLAVSNIDSELVQAVFTIKVEENYGKPPGLPGKPQPTSADYKILLKRYITEVPADLTIYTTNYEGITVTEFELAITYAAVAWDGATSEDLVDEIITVELGSGVVAVDNINALFFADLDSGVIAMASVWYSRFTKTIVECDIQFNTDFVWGDAKANPEVMDLWNIATHELGHFFNLADIYDTSKSYLTMYGYSVEGDIEKRDLAQGDKDGIIAVFGP
jgi:hypothetical protein